MQPDPVSRRLVALLLLAAASACASISGPPAAVLEPPRPVRHEIEDRGYDALHYRIHLTIPGHVAQFTGEVEVRLRATGPLRFVELDAADMTVMAAAVDGAPALFMHDQRLLRVDLPRPLAPGEETHVAIAYQVTQPVAGLHFSLPGESGVAGAMPQVFTQGEDIRARHWFPCFDAPHERASHEISASVPLSWEVVAAGRQISREVDAANSTATVAWRMEQQMPAYLFTLAAGPFVTVQDHWRGITLSHYVEPADMEAGRATFARTADVLEFFSEYTGFAYPYPKYAHVAVRDFPFGGMENASATTVTRAVVRPAVESPEGAWGLIAHEAAHQWFGDAVTCETWPHIWLNEGFATYFTNLYERHAFGEQAFLHGMGATLDGYLGACRGENLRAIVKHEYRLPLDLFFDGTIYPGGASRLQLLRGMLGEDGFRAGIRSYLEANAFRSVTTDVFQAAMSTAANRDLREWFAQWVHAPGYPVVEIAWREDGWGDARIELKQVQDGAGVPAAFAFPLEVRWWEGESWRLRRFEVDAREHSWTLDLGEGFTGFLEFDPNVWVPALWTIREEPAATRARARRAGSARVRALACRDLAAAGDSAAIATLFEAAQRDALPALRAEAANLVGPLLGGDEGTRIHAAHAVERDASVREAWWGQLGRFAAQAFIGDEMLRSLTDPRAPIDERESSLCGLAGALEGEELRTFLGAFAFDAGAHERLRNAAIGLLGARLPDHLTRGALLPLSWSGNETPVRATALRALQPFLADAREDDPGAMSVVDSYRIALRSSSAQLRSAAAEGAGAHPQWFRAEIAELLRRDPDARIRRLLENDR